MGSQDKGVKLSTVTILVPCQPTHSFDINITIGAYERLCVAGSPQTKYSPSFGANVLASEVRRCALNYSPFVQLFFEAFEFIVLTRVLPP